MVAAVKSAFRGRNRIVSPLICLYRQLQAQRAVRRLPAIQATYQVPEAPSGDSAGSMVPTAIAVCNDYHTDAHRDPPSAFTSTGEWGGSYAHPVSLL